MGLLVTNICLRLGITKLDLGFSLALVVCVLRVVFFVSSQFVK